MALPQSHPPRRAPRAHLSNFISVRVQRENGRRAKGKLQTVSTTGGLLQLAKALGQGDFVEVAFQTHVGKVHGLAEMLNAEPQVKSRPGVLQPFRFVALADDDHRALLLTADYVPDRQS